MMWRVEFKQQALYDLKKLDPVIAQRILSKSRWLVENIDQITPQPLTAKLRGLFKLRIGDYRLLYSISSKTLLITVHMIGHRREIYRER